MERRARARSAGRWRPAGFAGDQPQAAPNAAPGTPAGPQTALPPGMPDPRYLNRKPLIPREYDYALRMRGDPHAEEAFMQLQAQRQGIPVDTPYMGGNIRTIAGHPEMPPIFMPPAAQKSDLKYPGGMERPMFTRPTLQGGMEEIPVQTAGGAPGTSALADYPKNPAEAGKMAAEMEGQKAKAKTQSEVEAKAYQDQYSGIQGADDIARKHKQFNQFSRSIVQDKGFYSGVWSPQMNWLRSAAVNLGLRPE